MYCIGNKISSLQSTLTRYIIHDFTDFVLHSPYVTLFL